MQHYPRILTIAGADSGGGAGIQADLKTIAALGAYGMSAITALTAQNTLGVQRVEAVSDAMLAAQIESVLSDIGADAVKIGMLVSVKQVEIVAEALLRYQPPWVVLDPVLAPSSGPQFMDASTRLALCQTLLPLVHVLTPNLGEAARLCQQADAEVHDVASMQGAGQALRQAGAGAVYVKGGHLPAGADVAGGLQDVWVSAQHPKGQVLTHPRLESANLHGTGCTLASALATYLACGMAVDAAAIAAQGFVAAAIAAGAGVVTGAGNGPLNHGFAPLPMRLR